MKLQKWQLEVLEQLNKSEVILNRKISIEKIFKFGRYEIDNK